RQTRRWHMGKGFSRFFKMGVGKVIPLNGEIESNATCNNLCSDFIFLPIIYLPPQQEIYNLHNRLQLLHFRPKKMANPLCFQESLALSIVCLEQFHLQ